MYFVYTYTIIYNVFALCYSFADPGVTLLWVTLLLYGWIKNAKTFFFFQMTMSAFPFPKCWQDL